ncbi:hypothetical protein ASZ90_018966 [hydrocarbon metagenome]|uniref:Uncharacterized protein n=1 Tax=hydrocarbon metagenome TaxID=938273 RepID=A0A0W8E4Q5_9ZZZZ
MVFSAILRLLREFFYYLDIEKEAKRTSIIICSYCYHPKHLILHECQTGFGR